MYTFVNTHQTEYLELVNVMAYSSIKLNNIFKLIKLFSAMAAEDPKSFICLPAGLSIPGIYCCYDILVLKCMKGGLMGLSPIPMVIWAHKLPLPQRDLCLSGHSSSSSGLVCGPHRSYYRNSQLKWTTILWSSRLKKII